jgi:hypothetical protein
MFDIWIRESDRRRGRDDVVRACGMLRDYFFLRMEFSWLIEKVLVLLLLPVFLRRGGNTSPHEYWVLRQCSLARSSKIVNDRNISWKS